MEAGEFDNLPQKGQPIRIDSNPFEDSSLWMAHHLLRVNGFPLAWVEESSDIDRAVAKLKIRSRTCSPALCGDCASAGTCEDKRLN